MKIALVTLAAGEEFARMAALVNPAKRRYCSRFDYDFIQFDGQLDTSRPPAWSKIPVIRKVLPNYDWLFWCDTDAVLWNPDAGLRQFIGAAGPVDAIFQANQDGANSGLFFLRNSPWSFAFLDEIYRQEQFIHHPWWENAAIIDLLARDDVRSHVQLYPPRGPLGGFHGFRPGDDWDKVFIHHAGLRGEARMLLIENLVRLAELPVRRRMLTRGELGQLLNRMDLLGEGVEIGVASGEFSRSVLDIWEGRRLHLVDAWKHRPDYIDVANVSGEEHDERLRSVPQRLAAHRGRYAIHRALSRDAAERFARGSLDFAYIDADHSYEAVREDLRLWYPKVRSGGLLAGHDFLDGDLPQGKFGVRRAILDFERELGVRAAVTTELDWPTWYFVKP
ncbi:MAG TPA: class I SAM-dependent methyltransferase [Pirellulales bacterium]